MSESVTPTTIPLGTQEDAVVVKLDESKKVKEKAAESKKRVALRIREFRGKPVVNRFFPWGGVPVKAHEVFYAKDRAEAKTFLDTGIVEMVLEEEPDEA